MRDIYVVIANQLELRSVPNIASIDRMPSKIKYFSQLSSFSLLQQTYCYFKSKGRLWERPYSKNHVVFVSWMGSKNWRTR